jgi:hypothetical protein
MHPLGDSPAGFRLKEATYDDNPLTTIRISVPHDVVRRIDDLRQLELLSRSAWLRREVVLAVRANDHIEAVETKGNA